MSLEGEQSQFSNRKRPYSDHAEIKKEPGSVSTASAQMDLMQCLGISSIIDVKKPQETLPDLDDPDAIDAFFRRSRRQRSPAHEASEGTLPNNHPMKEFVEQPENREMSVKEALARGFRNYRVRLPKNRKVVAPTEIQHSTSITYLNPSTSTSQAVLPQEDTLLTTEPTPTNLNEMLASTYTLGDIMEFGENIKKSRNDKSDNEQNINISSNSLPLESYPLPPFWQLNPYVSKGYKGGFYVQGNKYVQITTLIINNQFCISLNEPVTFVIDGKIVGLTLKQLFAANGIMIRDANNVEQIKELFNSSFLLINNYISQFLLNGMGSGSEESFTQTRSRNRWRLHDPIFLSKTTPPFACYQLPLFLISLETQFGENEILDSSHFPVQTDSPAASRSISPKDPSHQTEPYDQEPSTSKAVITKEEKEDLGLRQKLLVITSVVAGQEVAKVAKIYGISREQVEIIMHDRSNIQQEATEKLIERSRDEAVEQKIEQDMNEINAPRRISDSSPKELRTIKKNRVRRTSFVGLNVGMWRFFKDCADKNITLNGKQLKERAMIISKQLGLDQFKGSEGWLDAFKRRHKIDLKQMTGSPANYEDEGMEEITDIRMDNEETIMEEGRTSETERSSPMYYSYNTSAATNGSVTAALLSTVEKASQPTAVASISNTLPLDLQHLLGETAEADLINCLMTSSTSSPYMSNGVSGFVNLRESSSESNQQTDERGLIAAVVRSAAVHIPDKEISFAMDTIRSYILTHDSAAMPKFLELQLQLANIAKKNVSKTVAPTETKYLSMDNNIQPF